MQKADKETIMGHPVDVPKDGLFHSSLGLSLFWQERKTEVLELVVVRLQGQGGLRRDARLGRVRPSRHGARRELLVSLPRRRAR